MKILFIGLLYDRTEEKYYLKKSKVGLQNATNTFQWNFINGIESNRECSLTIYNVLPVGTYPQAYRDIILPTRKWTHNNISKNIEVGSVNIPILKQITRTINYYKIVDKWIRENPNHKNIIVYSLYEPVIDALRRLKMKHTNIVVNVIVTDLPSVYGILPKQKIKAALFKWHGNRILNKLDFVDSFILLTKYMTKPLKVGCRPYVVIEGISTLNDVILNRSEIASKGKKVIFYSGTLLREFGIDNLLKAFKLIINENYELWIAGSGNAQHEVIKIASKDKRIKCLGYVQQSKVIELQQQATVLINPRQNDGEYTRYSFPSKTMEYLVSGKPVIMYKLDGIPNEYDDYIYYVEDNSVESLKNRIIEVCSKTEEELFEFGQKAKEFISKEKNEVVQTDKVMKMIKNIDVSNRERINNDKLR